MKPLPLIDWDESLSHVIDDMNGRPLNVHGLMANHPELLNAWWDYRNHAVGGGALEQRDCELVILRVATHMQSWYEWASHVDRGLASGLSVEDIERVRRGPDDSGWNDRDAALLRGVDELVTERGISPAMQEELANHFTDVQLLDVIAIHGMYITLGCMINTWGLALDESVERRLPSSVSQDAFERSVKIKR
ncbi:MAG: carboxymuconolactone decarboxylase family protein [Gammaproteobacteria bacterium]|nr:carboxymuconolactone decarboxylase family protein [Gammaproteobacteria bacterium]NNC57631.1 carboxymuconolactone decarboxylase family protein [Woeseiaceae bacterium]